MFVQLSEWFASGMMDHDLREHIAAAAASLRSGERPIPPFHWEIEFPEVFSRENGGFDAFVGNPPFAGKNTITKGAKAGYLDWLKETHNGTHGNAELVAHFFRRTFSNTRNGGCLGPIATNTIAQGDTRGTGLYWICTNGGRIYDVRRRVRWPGQAAVVVSVLNIAKSIEVSQVVLDGRPVSEISAFLLKGSNHDDPKQLLANSGKSFQGCILLGMGFSFDDNDSTGNANSIALMNELLAILHLRELHAAMDRAVLEAYGWDDLAAAARCEFLLDYEEEEEEAFSGQQSAVSKRKKRKPWRLRWPDDFRDEVLARLLELNEQRHQKELLAGKASKTTAKTPTGSKKRDRKKSSDDAGPHTLF